jgi:hypothetical protein
MLYLANPRSPAIETLSSRTEMDQTDPTSTSLPVGHGLIRRGVQKLDQVTSLQVTILYMYIFYIYRGRQENGIWKLEKMYKL